MHCPSEPRHKCWAFSSGSPGIRPQMSWMSKASLEGDHGGGSASATTECCSSPLTEAGSFWSLESSTGRSWTELSLGFLNSGFPVTFRARRRKGW